MSCAPDCVGKEVEKELVGDETRGGAVAGESGFQPMMGRQKRRVKMSKEDVSGLSTVCKYCDLYINDAFGTAHRAHALYGCRAEKVGPGAAGYLMQKELDYFSLYLRPGKPLMAILGGAKVSDKLW